MIEHTLLGLENPKKHSRGSEVFNLFTNINELGTPKASKIIPKTNTGYLGNLEYLNVKALHFAVLRGDESYERSVQSNLEFYHNPSISKYLMWDICDYHKVSGEKRAESNEGGQCVRILSDYTTINTQELEEESAVIWEILKASISNWRTRLDPRIPRMVLGYHLVASQLISWIDKATVSDDILGYVELFHKAQKGYANTKIGVRGEYKQLSGRDRKKVFKQVLGKYQASWYNLVNKQIISRLELTKKEWNQYVK